jgi:superfamily I DNA/RNA helicase
MIGQASEGFRKELLSDKRSGERPQLVIVADEATQIDYVIERVLEHREAGIDLKHQAVLFRASHHSDQLEVEFARRDIPFVKYGGLKFLEAAHVKDVLCVLCWIENPRDAIAAFLVLQLLPGIGPATAREAGPPQRSRVGLCCARRLLDTGRHRAALAEAVQPAFRAAPGRDPLGRADDLGSPLVSAASGAPLR